MTLSEEEFNQQCLEFVRRSRDYSDHGWTLLARRADKQIRRLDERHFDPADLGGGDAKLMLTKEERRRCGKTARICNFEYSVLFSESYEVPVMYFSVSDQNGAHVPLEDILETSHEDLSSVVNQVEHPLLFRPFYMVHPCRTRDFMAPHLEAASRPSYIISWLSVVATLVGLRLSSQFGRPHEPAGP